MSKVVFWVAGAAIGLGLSGYNAFEYSQDEKAVLAKYEFTEAEKTGFEMCQAAMRRADTAFDNTSDNQGCGCITRQISNRVDARFRIAAHEIDTLDTWYAARGYAEAYHKQWLEKVDAVGTKYNMSSSQLQNTVDKIDSIVKQCSS